MSPDIPSYTQRTSWRCLKWTNRTNTATQTHTIEQYIIDRWRHTHVTCHTEFLATYLHIKVCGFATQSYLNVHNRNTGNCWAPRPRPRQRHVHMDWKVRCTRLARGKQRQWGDTKSEIICPSFSWRPFLVFVYTLTYSTMNQYNCHTTYTCTHKLL